jgi:protein kinase A
MSTFDPMTVNQADLTFNHPPPPKYAPPASTDLPNLVSPIIQPPTPLPPSTPLSHSTPTSANHQQQQSHLLQQQQLQQYQQHQHQQHELLKQQQQQLKQQQQQLKQQQHELLLQQQQTNPQFPASSPIPASTPLESNPSGSQASDPTKTSRKTSSRYALADFDLIRTLGTGSFGRVHLSKSRHNGRGYAIKVSLLFRLPLKSLLA